VFVGRGFEQEEEAFAHGGRRVAQAWRLGEWGDRAAGFGAGAPAAAQGADAIRAQHVASRGLRGDDAASEELLGEVGWGGTGRV